MKKLFFILISILFASQTFAQSSAQSSIAKGSKVTILEIAKGDTYYSERADFVGTSATILGVLNKNDNGFYSGTLETESGRTCFFKNVKVDVNSAPTTSTVSSNAAFSGPISKDTKVKVLEVSVDDSYYKDKSQIVGKTGKVTADISASDKDGYYSGNVLLDNGQSYYFYKAKLVKTNSSTSTTSSSKTSVVESLALKSSPKFVTGTIKNGTKLYLAEISSDDSYYSDRFDKIGKHGTVNKSDLTSKEDGYYAGDFLYDDGSTAYFYKARFSKEPVDKLTKSSTSTTTPTTNSTTTNSTTTKSTKDDYSDLAYLFGGGDSDDDWSSATNDENIKPGDKVEITAINSEDSYFEDKSDYIGKRGVVGSDIEYQDLDGGYGGSVKLESGLSANFYLVKLKKVGSSSSTSSSATTKSSTSSNAINYGESIAKGTKVKVVDVDSDDSFYANKSTYIGKSGKVAEGMTHQGNGLYSGKILFTDGTDAYFFKVSLKKL